MLGRVFLWVLALALLLSLLSAAVKLLVLVLAIVASAAVLVWLFKARRPLFCALALVAVAYVGLRAGPWGWAVVVLWVVLELAHWGLTKLRWPRGSDEAAFAGRGQPDALEGKGGV